MDAVAVGGEVIKLIPLERLTQTRRGELSLRRTGHSLVGDDGLGLAINIGVNQLEIRQPEKQISIFISLSECREVVEGSQVSSIFYERYSFLG